MSPLGQKRAAEPTCISVRFPPDNGRQYRKSAYCVFDVRFPPNCRSISTVGLDSRCQPQVEIGSSRRQAMCNSRHRETSGRLRHRLRASLRIHKKNLLRRELPIADIEIAHKFELFISLSHNRTFRIGVGLALLRCSKSFVAIAHRPRKLSFQCTKCRPCTNIRSRPLKWG